MFGELKLEVSGGLFLGVVVESVFIFECRNEGVVFGDEFGFGGVSEEEFFLLLEVFLNI